FVNGGTSFGIAQGPGMGRACAEWILDGAPWIDGWVIDPRRFGTYASPQWVSARVKDVYDNEYALTAPHEHGMRTVARGVRTTPATARHIAAKAMMTTGFGWERPAWFGTNGATSEHHGFRRMSDPHAFQAIDAECKAVREGVGLLDLSAFTKFDVMGKGAEAAIDRLGANRAPRRDGRVVLTHALTDKGGVRSEFTITRLSAEHFYCVSAAAAELHDLDLLQEAVGEGGDAVIEPLTNAYGCLVLAGPRARQHLAPMTDADLSMAAFPWLTAQNIVVAGVPVRALRVSFVGELGWELHHRIEHQATLYDALMDASPGNGPRPFGLRAMESLRLEKGYRAWRTDLTTERTVLEAGMDRFVKLDPGRTFRGRGAIEYQVENSLPSRLATLRVDTADADAMGGEPVWREGANAPIGFVTSGGYGHATSTSLALAYINADDAVEGGRVAVTLLGERRPAQITFDAVYDPSNERMRA
ncbi:MAG: glycine cleavage T C-terminal barrel domain-containing protein, partial [Pseudomonadota bacterium]